MVFDWCNPVLPGFFIECLTRHSYSCWLHYLCGFDDGHKSFT